MTKQQFEAIFERLTPRRREVLLKFLANESDEAIANSLHITKATVRKTIEKICEQFGLKNDFPDERRSKRQDLVALFAKYKPELLGGCSSVVENEEAIAHPHQDGEEAANGLANELEGTASNNPNLVEPQVGEDLMSLATKILEQLGFNQKFKVSKAFQYVGYQLKIPKNEFDPYQLVLVQRKEGLSIYIPKNILEQTLLYLMYYVNYDGFDVGHSVAGIFWVLPSKKEIFLESLHRNYWSVIKGQTEGSFYLNDVDDDGYGCGPVIPSRLLDEFSPNTLSNTNSYLVLSDDQRFPGTWQVCICSLEVLEEFIGHFGEKILMAN